VYAINETTGALRWATGLFVGNPVTLAGNVLVVSTSCGLAWGLNATTGKVVWNDNPGCDGGGTLMASFDGASVWGDDPGGGGQGRVFNSGTGQVIKRFPGEAPAFGYSEAVQPAFDSAGTLEIHAFNPATMATRWTFIEPGGTTNPYGSAPLLADGYVFAEGSQGTVWALKPCVGGVVWQGSAGGPAQYFGFDPLPSLAAGDGYLVVPTQTGLTAFKGSGMPRPTPPACTGSH
jgi:outer membrane protein assembly factor BamB